MLLRLMVVLCMLFIVSPAGAADKLELKTQQEKFSYALGVNMGTRLKADSVDVNPDILARAIKDILAGSKPLLTEQEAREIIIAVQKDVQTKQQVKNKKDGDAFLAKNKTKDGVKTLASGLQYKVITEGKGKSPLASDTVTVHYSGTLIDGTEFDSSLKRGTPATFPVGGVIKGWTEALQLMKEGSKWQLVIPADLAYGEAGRPGIPPNAVLIFDVELISVK